MKNCRVLGKELIETIFSETGPGIAASAFADGFLLNETRRGRIDLDAHMRIDGNTAFHVASISKQFTAYAIARLVIEKQLRLKDKIGLYLPFLNERSAEISIDQLLFHTSGLNDQWVLLDLSGWNDSDLASTRDINKLVSRQGSLKNSPGSAFSYTNTGYTMLAQIVERVAGQSLDEYLQSVLFRPNGMTHTRFRSDPKTRVAFEAECYSQELGGFVKTTPRFSTVGATSLQTSLADLARWEPRLTDANDEISHLMRTRGSLRTGQEIGYGFGVYHGAVGAISTLSHSGWDADFSSYVVYLPKERIGAAVLSNGSQMNLELIALSFLTEFVDFGQMAEEIELRLTTMMSGVAGGVESAGAEHQRKAFGSLDSGDIRIWKQDEHGSHLISDTIQRAELIHDDSYMLAATLSTLRIEDNALVISSPTQDQRQSLALLPSSYQQHVLNSNVSFFSSELEVTHTISESNGRLLWCRPGHEASALEEIGSSLCFCDGFTLLVSQETLTIFNARSAPIRFARV